MTSYEEAYARDELFWGEAPSKTTELFARHLPSEARILDLGAGEGRNACYLASFGHRVVALELAAAGVEKTRRLVAESGVELELVVRGDATDLDLVRSLGTFEGVLASGLLHFLPYRAIKDLVPQLQGQTVAGGVHGLVVQRARDRVAADDAFLRDQWLFGEGELAGFYAGWDLLDHLEYEKPAHREAGMRYFSRLLARKPVTAASTSLRNR